MFDVDNYRYNTAVTCSVYQNYSVFVFKNSDIKVFESPDFEGLSKYLSGRKTYGFCSLNYVIPILLAAYKGSSSEELYKLSKSIINKEYTKTIQATKKHLDLGDIALCAGNRRAPLNLLVARDHFENIEELNFSYDQKLSDEQIKRVRENCIDKVLRLEYLKKKLEDEISIRALLSAQFNTNLMNKSNGDIVETIFSSVIEPDKIQKQQSVNDLEERNFQIGSMAYRARGGGLHSTESCRAIVNKKIVELDVISYYPSIIAKFGIQGLGVRFRDVYQDLINRRIEAKKQGNDALSQGLKIIINSLFGKLNCKFSVLYAPSDFEMVVREGQDRLLELIELIEGGGNSVVSANTDGLFVVVGNDEALLKSCQDWEQKTGYILSRNEFTSLYSKDVNNYFAVKAEVPVSVKGRGIFGRNSLYKNPAGSVCAEAVINFAIYNIPIRETIIKESDIRKFLYVSSVKEGATHQGEYIGKVIRYYMSINGSPFFYKNTRKKVEQTEKAKPLMILPHNTPGDIDYELYIERAEKLAESVNLI